MGLQEAYSHLQRDLKPDNSRTMNSRPPLHATQGMLLTQWILKGPSVLVSLPMIHKESGTTAKSRDAIISMLETGGDSVFCTLNNYKMHGKNAKSKRMDTQAILKSKWGYVPPWSLKLRLSKFNWKASNARKR